MKEKEDLENIIKNLEKENDNLIIEKENLISNMNHIDSRIKAKAPKTTDLGKRLQNIGQSSLTMIRTDMGLDKSTRKRNNQGNVSMDSGISDDKNNITSSGKKDSISVSNSSAQKIKISNSFSGHKNMSNSNEKKLVCTCGLCEKEDSLKKSSEFNDLERKSNTYKNNK